jgi:hypothetical protein
MTVYRAMLSDETSISLFAVTTAGEHQHNGWPYYGRRYGDVCLLQSAEWRRTLEGDVAFQVR